MRTISSEQLPLDLNNVIVIKLSERNRNHRMSTALERTLIRCSEIRSENEFYIAQLRSSAEKEGFHTGFGLFFSELLAMLEKYEHTQNVRMATYRQHLADALKEALIDPLIIERIIHHLTEKSLGHKVLTITLPKTVNLPLDNSNINYQFTDDNHITIQNDVEAIRFPSHSLCSQWVQYADQKIDSLNNSLNSLTPSLLRDIAEKLIGLSYFNTSPLVTEEIND